MRGWEHQWVDGRPRLLWCHSGRFLFKLRSLIKSKLYSWKQRITYQLPLLVILILVTRAIYKRPNMHRNIKLLKEWKQEHFPSSALQPFSLLTTLQQPSSRALSKTKHKLTDLNFWLNKALMRLPLEQWLCLHQDQVEPWTQALLANYHQKLV